MSAPTDSTSGNGANASSRAQKIMARHERELGELAQMTRGARNETDEQRRQRLEVEGLLKQARATNQELLPKFMQMQEQNSFLKDRASEAEKKSASLERQLRTTTEQVDALRNAALLEADEAKEAAGNWERRALEAEARVELLLRQKKNDQEQVKIAVDRGNKLNDKLDKLQNSGGGLRTLLIIILFLAVGAMTAKLYFDKQILELRQQVELTKQELDKETKKQRAKPTPLPTPSLQPSGDPTELNSYLGQNVITRYEYKFRDGRHNLTVYYKLPTGGRLERFVWGNCPRREPTAGQDAIQATRLVLERDRQGVLGSLEVIVPPGLSPEADIDCSFIPE